MERFREVLQEIGPPGKEELGSAVLTDFVVMAAWMDEDGERWLSRMYPPETPYWVAIGMLRDGELGDWRSEE